MRGCYIKTFGCKNPTCVMSCPPFNILFFSFLNYLTHMTLPRLPETHTHGTPQVVNSHEETKERDEVKTGYYISSGLIT